MLKELHIKNLAIIDELIISFSEGFNILTGETGGGKSIIIDSISLILGIRGVSSLIREPYDEGYVEAIFDIVDNVNVVKYLKKVGIDAKDELLIKRVILKSGKNRIFINGNVVTLNMLSELGSRLINIYGQYEYQTLLTKDRYIDLLDEFGDIIPLRMKFENLYNRLSYNTKEFNRLLIDDVEKSKKLDFMKFQLKEIEDANLKDDSEYETLNKERNILINAEKIANFISLWDEIVYTGEKNIIGELSILKDGLKNIDKSLYNRFESLIVELKDIHLTLLDFNKRIEFDPKRLEYIESRLNEIERLKRKYGSTIDDIFKYRDKIINEMKDIEMKDINIDNLKKEIIGIQSEMIDLANLLSQKRKDTSNKLSILLKEELKSLCMEGVKFRVDILENELNLWDGKRELKEVKEIGFNEKGINSVDFLISPNIGERLKPLSKIASGGELSRIMLAIKKVITEESKGITLIFDEIDSGIGGRTANVVGEKLKEVSKNHQVICVTHLPQISRFADTHFYVTKEVTQGRTVTRVKKLEGEDRIEELARMLDGSDISKEAKDHARELLYH